MADNDNNEIQEINLLESLHPNFGDPMQLLNMRHWLEGAVESKGAKVDGGSVGMGKADIDITLEGHGYNITIMPLLK